MWPESGLESYPWKTLKPSIPFDSLEALGLDKYEGVYRRCWLEALTISKDDFGQWCDDHEHTRPAFWFGDELADTDVATTEPGRNDGKAGEQTVEGRRIALQRLAKLLRKNNPKWTKRKIAEVICDNPDFQKHKGQGKLRAESIEREIRLPRPKRRTPRQTP